MRGAAVPRKEDAAQPSNVEISPASRGVKVMQHERPDDINATLHTLREAAAVPLRDCLDPYARLPLPASRSCVLAWLAILYPCRRDRLDPPEALIADRLKQARDLLPPERWRAFLAKFRREVLA